MKINAFKFGLMCFLRSRSIQFALKTRYLRGALTISGVAVPVVNVYKDLGLIVESKLNFEDHAKSVSGK